MQPGTVSGATEAIAVPAMWLIFVIGTVSVAIVVVAFAAALVLAQRRRLSLQQDYAQRILRAHEEERAWVARELHDDLLQRVAMIRHDLDSLWATLSSCATPGEAHRLRALNAELLDLGVVLRGVAQRLHPTIVDQLGLPRALEALAGEVRRASALQVTVSVPDHDTPIDRTVAHAAYRIAQEALRNTVRHSGATSADIELAALADAVLLRIRDHGRGFEDRGDRPRGLGLISMRERAGIVHGTLTIASRPGEGTLVEAMLPRTAA